MYSQFKSFIVKISETSPKTEIIQSYDVLSYKANLPDHQKWYVGSLSGFLQKWVELGYPGVSEDVSRLLNLQRLPGNDKGWAVLTMDPEEGPFTEIELQVIHQAVNQAFATGKIGTRQYSLIWLFFATGSRPVQIADAKVMDLTVGHNEQGLPEYILHVPRAKQRAREKRSEFKARHLSKPIGEVLLAWIARVKQEGMAIAPGLPVSELPLFPSWNSLNAPGFEHHSSGQKLSVEVQSVLDSLEITSYRTGERMKMHPMRFRYTLGTRAAAERNGPLVIAEMLDHSDTQNVMVYIKATPPIIETLDQALADELAPLAGAFAGKLDAVTTFRMAPESVVRNPKSKPSKGKVGNCGGCAGCTAMAPFGCYVCHNFVAWVDGPHEEVLEHLVAERGQWLKESGDQTTAYAKDHIILAVAEVVRMCREMRGSLQ